MRLLLAEDEKELANAVCAILKHNHYSVDAVYNGNDAYDYGRDNNYDCLILDVMMPGCNGFLVVENLRKAKVQTPILLLTAKAEVEDRIKGLDNGADDYLTKPFAMGELLARIRALTRRREEFSSNILSFGNINLNRENFELYNETAAFRLGSKEFQMMEMLLLNPKRLLSADTFLERIWGYEAETGQNVIWVYISYLRKKLTGLNANIGIKAVRGMGYTLEELI